ncbi:MAG TPA: site-specific integrase [Chryseosolibacter sp.]
MPRKRNTDLNRKEPVRLRQRRIKNGGYSLYLDTYWNGKRSYDFLKLYLNPPTDDLAIIENKTTLELAKQIKYKRILELQTGLHGSAVVKPRPKFRDFFAELASEKIRFDNNAGNWASAYKHVLVFLADDNPTIQEIDDIWLEKFRAYLLEVDKRSGKPRLSSSTALSYFNRVRTALTTAYERRMIERNPANLARPIRAENAMREFLTLNEVKRLVETRCDQPVLKDAFLFCVVTGLRWSDIAHLTWEEVKGKDMDGWYLHFKQRKTKLCHVLPITTQAKELLGERLESNQVVFSHLKYSSKTSAELCRWAIAAGVAKRITFHSARHTHATLLLSQGVDIYTVSKLLGHRHVVSTERYAHVTDKLKTEAINKLAGIHLHQKDASY